ncbi:Calponin-homology (CH) domain-containing protein [Durusdinium trenchii]|uniref:Calponin-homology (CH) domain-containing protein n=1 Tax=Durusdinium trenchii TaxID=1381693 RepID=A0ABP0KZA9_9DINO
MADAELTRLVQAVEAAQLASRALTDEDVAALDRARSTVGSTAAEITSAARLELRSLAHRLWAAVAQGLATSKEGAKCRSLACELFVGSFVSETMPTKDAASLAVHWAFAGRAWMLAEEPQSAQDCFTESAKQWKLQPQRLAPMATQTFIWAAEAHFSQAAYSEAFSSLVQARELIGELISRMPKEQQEAVLNNFLGTCYEQALSHRVAGNAAQASDLLNLALGAAGTVAASSRCRLLRALARLGPCDNGLVHAKQALALSPNSKERVLSFQVILELVVGEGKPPESRHLKRVWFEMWVPSPRVEGPQDSFASTANTIFASNPRILEEQKQQWREEKGLSGLWDPNKDPRRAPSPRSPEERAGRPVAAPLRRRGVPQSWVDEEMGEQDQPLLRQVPSTEAPRDDFHRCRWRCIWQPERAVETLGAVAQLQLSIVRGKDLACHELSSLFQPTCNAAAKVYLDDTLVCQSKCQQRTRDPDWKFQKSLDVTCPYSMLRVHVVDFGNSNAVTRHQIGFVEINLGDLPLNKELIGWFELRHPDALKRTSWERYATHCQRRDDQMPRLRKPRVPVQKLQQESQEFSPDGNDTLNTSGQRSFLGSCASYLGRSTAELQRQVSEAIKPEERENAGEILLRLRLSYLDRARDSFFAKALQPACVHHGTSILQADSDSDFHLQHLWDDVIDVKQQVLQDAVSSTANFFRYILHWRSNILSAILLVSLTGPLCYSALFPHPRNLWLWTAVVPGVIALLHLLLSISSARAFMLQGGTNAPLTQEGFVRTAAWRDTEQMVAFIDRVVLDTNGCVCDQRELRSFAARCFRDGKPRLTLGELRTGLKASNWVSFDLPAVPSDADGEGKTLLREGCPSTEVQPGDLVLVDGKRRAWVTRLAPSELVVEYEDMEEVHSKQPEVGDPPKGVRDACGQQPQNGGEDLQASRLPAAAGPDGATAVPSCSLGRRNLLTEYYYRRLEDAFVSRVALVR